MAKKISLNFYDTKSIFGYEVRPMPPIPSFAEQWNEASMGGRFKFNSPQFKKNLEDVVRKYGFDWVS